MSGDYNKELEKHIEKLESIINGIYKASWVRGIPETDGFYFLRDPAIRTHEPAIYQFKDLDSGGRYTSTEMDRWCDLEDEDSETVDILNKCVFYGPLIQPEYSPFAEYVRSVFKDNDLDWLSLLFDK